MKRILITGGAGFVGSHLAMGLRAACEAVEVLAFDNLKRRGSELNLSRLREAGVGFLHGDVRSLADLEQAGKADLVIECSAEPSVLAGYGESPEYVVHTNLTGAMNCLEFARRHEAGMLFLSTSRVYPIEMLRNLRFEETETRFTLAASQEVPGVSVEGISELAPLDGPRSIYGATKLAAEIMLAEYRDAYGLPIVVNRCGVITGPWQMGKVDQGVVVLWAARHAYGGKLQYIGYGGSGKQVRDLLHVDDLLQLVLHQVAHLDALQGQTFNVGGGTACSASLLEMTQLCQEFTGNSIEIGSVAEDRVADVPLYVTDARKVQECTGWQPKHNARGVFDDVCRWLRDHRAALEPLLRQGSV